MPRTLDPALREALAERLRFYRDLGLTEFYRRPVDPAAIADAPEIAVVAAESSAPSAEQELAAQSAAVRASSETADMAEPVSKPVSSQSTHSRSFGEEPAIPARKPIAVPPPTLEIIPPADRQAALQIIREDIGECTRCALHKGRNKIVFADGSPTARLMFVGEGPGADEDAQGLPFVGRAGQLLNNMITAMGLKREEVYIANVVKCRPPGNRTPEPEEAHTCSPFLFRQIDVVRPQVIVALGATAATYLLGQRQPLAGLRGRVHAFRGSQLIVTYHPAFLLRDPRQKKEAWADLQIAMRELGLKAPGKA
ncbi:MAG TPA: uracil-DNA glycosylase [Terracidiphilus sp.]|nr:uracil-DNA glycosylase [Terracidiphilus sp.]